MASAVVREGKVGDRTPSLYGPGRSDQIIVPWKAANKVVSARVVSAAAEWLEGRVWREGSCDSIGISRALYLHS